MQAYLDEFTFRFNRRGVRHRGLLFRRLLEHTVNVGPVTYRSLVVNHAPKRTRSSPPPTRRVAPPTLDITVPARPWRSPNP